MKNLQIIVNKDVEHYADLLEEGIGSCIQFRGEIVKIPGDKQPIEMKVEKNDTHYVKIMNLCLRLISINICKRSQKNENGNFKRNIPFKT